MNEDLKKNFASLTNNPGRRWQAGYAKFGLATSVIADVEKQCGFELLVKEMTEERLPSQDPNMICSEFAAKTTVAALVLLDSWLVNELQKKGVTVEHALEIPISPQRRFETIYPSELLTLFAKALKKIPSPPVLTSLLQGG